MPKAQAVSETNLDQVLHSVAQLDTLALEEVLQQVSRLLARRKAPSVPQREVELLQQISNYLSPAVRARYHQLNAKLHDDLITEAEHQEFLTLVDQVELADAKRLQHLIELAQLRGVSLAALMTQLGLGVSSHA
ncbi:MAG: STAS/SEC14 domain-containing protein [Caldilinea sp. CFX5]|nr:STAS/SEC14 domain-containing protein [Caldilinea sp. CFX5]